MTPRIWTMRTDVAALIAAALIVAVPAAAAQQANSDPLTTPSVNEQVSEDAGICNGLVDFDCYEMVCDGDHCEWTPCQIWIAGCIAG